MKQSSSSLMRVMVIIVPYFLIAYMYFYIMLVERASLKEEIMASMMGDNSSPLQKSKSRFLTKPDKNNKLSYSSSMSSELGKRLGLVEHKLDSYLGFGSDPFLSSRVPAGCKKWTKLEEYCESIHGKLLAKTKCHLGMPICLDDFQYNNCTVYDFGIREQPDFGVILSRPPFNCKVFAFDPSPTTQKWYASDDAKELREQKNYYLFLFGGGYEDGSIELKEYNWDQVSIYQYPNRVVDNTNCTSQGKCRYHKYPMQKVHHLPVRSVQSVMKEFGHTKLDVLKLDVEGSEYRMLEALIQSGACRVVDQISLEWHHYDFDLRYGASSNPQLNVLHTLLKEECGIQQFWLHDAIGWPSNEKIYADMKLILRYNLAAFRRWPR